MKKLIGYKYKGTTYGIGNPKNFDNSIKDKAVSYPNYVLKNENTGEVYIREKYYSDDGSCPSPAEVQMVVNPEAIKAFGYNRCYFKDGTLKSVSNFLIYNNNSYCVYSKEVLQKLKEGFTFIQLQDIAEPLYIDVPQDRVAASDVPIDSDMALFECGYIICKGKLEKELIIMGDGKSDLPYYWYNQLKDSRFNGDINNYRVEGVKWEFNGDLTTSTDVGGHDLAAKIDGNWLKVCHLSNGFGDGNYTLRFRDDGNLLIR